ncbi:MAG: beta-ketoacyl synthase N-terminal-like domain-containing protein, partial [Isosphaeraceae bacterium]
MRRGRAYEIALVGMSCRFPGAPDLFAFWANILANRDLTREVPAERWPLEAFYDPDSRANDRVACRRGGYLDTPIPFDPAAYGIMPLAVAGGEPEQFLVLDAARAALADAAMTPGGLDRGRVEVVIGRGNYFNRGNLIRLQHGRMVAQTVGLLAVLHPEWTAEDLELLRHDLKASLPPFEAATIPGQLTNATAGRLADRLDLNGASFVVDAASASSLVALELGSRALIERRADLALVGGVYVEADVDFPLIFSQLGVLSRSGTARPFSVDADGLIPGEGVGVVVLKRLRDAERAGDRIYAVVKGVGLASDGRSRGLTSPSSKGHVRAIRRAHHASGIDPATVGLIEGHGLGVPTADRAELSALRRVFPPPKGGSRVLGAVSSQIGHAMPAAGMAGLIKTALALHHRLLPPTRGADRPDPRLAASGLELLPAARPWIHGDSQNPRRAGVSAFGFAGINAHAVLEEHAASADGITPGAILEWDTEAFLLAADDRAGLADLVGWLRDRLNGGTRHSLKDLAFTLNTGSPAAAGRARLGIVAASHDELAAHLAAIEPRLREPSCRQVRDARGLYYWEQPLGREGTLAFLFPGEGSQYPGMLADLCPHFPELRAVLDTADRIARESGEEVPPSHHLFGSSGSIPEALWAADTAVTAVLSSQWAIFQVLTRLGLRPDAVAGHSSGELPALAAAGVLRTEHTLERQLIRLAAIFHELEAKGAIPCARLVAAGTDRERAEAACRVAGQSVVVAIDNCPHQVVFAGPPAEVDRVVAHLRAEGVVCEELPFARAYHTPAFSAVLQPLAAFYASLELHAAQVPIYSCSTAGRMAESAGELRRLAVAQWTRRVDFRDTIEAMYRDGLRVFVDVGARGNLCGYVEDILRGRPAFAVAANLPRRSGTAQLNHLVASLFAHGLRLDPSYLYARRRPQRIALDASSTPARSLPGLDLGFPELKLSDALIARLRERSSSAPDLSQKFSRKLVCVNRETEASTHGLHHENNRHVNCNESLNTNMHVNGNGHHGGLGNVLPSGMPDLLIAPVQPHLPEQAILEAAHDAKHPSPAEDEAMLGFLGSMNDFLSTQHEVMQAYLLGARGSVSGESRDGPQPGPWVGTIREWEPGRRIVSHLLLDGDDDPVAENHTLGGRRVSALDPSRKGLPVLPFSVMAEILAEAGALLVPPGLVLESLLDVRAHKWVPYSRCGVVIIRGECAAADPRRVRVTLHHSEGDESLASAQGRLVYEGTVRFTDQAPEPIAASVFDLAHPRASKFTAERLYGEQWLFHGPPMQALTEVGPVSQEGISGTIAVRPLAGLLRRGEPPSFHTDPIALDTFTHLLGCWGLECLEQGDVVFPLRMGRLSIHGAAPETSTLVACRIQVRDVQRHRVCVDAELVRPDGRVWIQIRDWEDWRFYWPARYRDVFRSPDTILIGEELRLPGVAPRDAIAVWLAPPGDMARPIWREVLEQTQLSPEEQAACLALDGPEVRRTHQLWGRIAAKEAARRLWLATGDPPRFPADLAIVGGMGRPPRLRDLARPESKDLPAISIAHTEGIVVALAARNPDTPVGIDIEPVFEGAEGTDTLSLTDEERLELPTGAETSPGEWIARFKAARQAAAKA